MRWVGVGVLGLLLVLKLMFFVGEIVHQRHRKMKWQFIYMNVYYYLIMGLVHPRLLYRNRWIVELVSEPSVDSEKFWLRIHICPHRGEAGDGWWKNQWKFSIIPRVDGHEITRYFRRGEIVIHFFRGVQNKPVAHFLRPFIGTLHNPISSNQTQPSPRPFK